MKEGLKLRHCEVLSNIRHDPIGTDVDAEWVEIPFSELKKGHIFRLFDEVDGKERIEDGTSVCAALSDAGPTEPEGNFVVQSLELKGW